MEQRGEKTVRRESERREAEWKRGRCKHLRGKGDGRQEKEEQGKSEEEGVVEDAKKRSQEKMENGNG